MRAIRCGTTLAAVILAFTCGCTRGDHASVTISYRPEGDPDRMSLEPTTRQRILRAFKSYTEANGYKCREHVKRVEEVTCRGPKDLHVTFEPELNQPVFVARFGWLRSADRTHEEFERHVASFTRAMTSEAKGARVRQAEGG